MASVTRSVKIAVVVVFGVPLSTPAEVSEAQVGRVPLASVKV